MVQNPLADPYILGISSGASLGATFAFLIGTASLGGFLATAGVSGLAFIGSMSAALAVFALAAVGGKIQRPRWFYQELLSLLSVEHSQI